MNKQKQIIILLLLVIALAGGLAILFYSGYQKEGAMIRALEEEIDMVANEKVEIFKEIEESNQKREELNAQLKGYSEKIQNYQADIPVLKSEKESVLQEIADLEIVSSKLDSQREEIIRREQNLQRSLENVEKTYEELLQRIEFVRDEKSELEEELKSHIQSTKGVELSKIVVKVVKPAEGTIVEVSKEYNFAVVDIGTDSGVKKGDYLEIYRNNRLIAKALIENVYDDMSSIVVFNQWRHIDLAIGDSVKLQTS
jgi:septal ring factor EnvC (AmiA/AmiB activator)